MDAIDTSWTQAFIQQAARSWAYAADAIGSPFTRMRPKLFPDGNQWCALYGDDLQMGVCGFGDTPALAEDDFNRNWNSQVLRVTKEAAHAK